MFANITAERPSVLVACRGGNYRAVVTFDVAVTNGAANNNTPVALTVISSYDGSSGVTARSSSALSNGNEYRLNINSGTWELLYPCTADGSRLEPVTGEEWIAVCEGLRAARVAAAQATAAVAALRVQLQEAEQASTAAAAAVAQATVRFNNAI